MGTKTVKTKKTTKAVAKTTKIKAGPTHYTFAEFLAEASKNPKFRAAYDKEYRHLMRMHTLIEMYDQNVQMAAAAWDELVLDPQVNAYVREMKIARPVSWNGK